MEHLDGAWIQRSLLGEKLGRRVVVRPSVRSTNDLARAAAMSGASEGLVILAEEQTAGRGRAGRKWVSGRGDSVLLSVLLRPNLPAAQAFLLTALTACAAAVAVEAEIDLPCELKWPNDLLLRGKKAGGILTELGFLGDRVSYAIIGVGINVSTRFDESLDFAAGATNLTNEVGRMVSRNRLVVGLVREMSQRYVALLDGKRRSVFEEWRGRLSTLGKRVRVGYQMGDGDLTDTEDGLAENVAEDGALLLLRDDGTRVRILAGDVSLR